MQNRPRGNWVGGDQIKLDKIMAELAKLGVQIEFNDQPLFTPALLLQMYDIVHVWNFSMEWTKYQVWAASKHKRKLVCSMTYHETAQFIPYDNQQIMLNALDAAIYETQGEIERVKRHMTINPDKTYIIPNGIDEWWFKENKDKVPFKDYVLTVGRIEPSKGQLEASIACKKLGLPYVIIGEVFDENYFNQCLDNGAIVYPAMKQEELQKWYKNCKVYIQPSVAETWGMAVDEAGTQGVPIVISTGFERQEIPDVVLCIHADEVSIENAIREATSKPKSEAFKKQLKKRTWKKVAKEYLKIYETILNNSTNI